MWCKLFSSFLSLSLSLSLCFSLSLHRFAINREISLLRTQTGERGIERATAYEGESDVNGGTRAKRGMREGLIK